MPSVKKKGATNPHNLFTSLNWELKHHFALNMDSLNLNDTVWATIAPSPIHGVGVFAIRNIPKGQKIYANERTDKFWDSLEGVHPTIAKLVLQRWPLASRGFPFQSPNDDARLTSFMNHSKDISYDKYTDTVLQDIREGDEIFEDYEPELNLSDMGVL